MKELIIGEEYLFSNNGTHWKKDELRKVRDSNSIYRYLTNDFSYMSIKPIEPEERKLYTQSMYDNDEPIEVGMWFKDGRDDEHKCLLATDADGDVVILKDDGAYSCRKPKPFPDPIKLIDGKPYLYVNRDIERVGFYTDEHKGFRAEVEGMNIVYLIELCTNIRELTVKGE